MMSIEQMSHLPAHIKRFFNYTKFPMNKIIQNTVLHSSDTDFQMDINFPVYKIINYNQMSTINMDRIVKMRTMKWKIFPVDVTDEFVDGKRKIKGVFMKYITMFEASGPYYDHHGFHVYLAEAAYLPHILLNRNALYQVIDDTHVEMKLMYKGIDGSVVYHIDEKGQMLSARVEKMFRTLSNEQIVVEPWKLIYDQYHEHGDYMLPMNFITTYESNGYDLVEYDSNLDGIYYNV